MSHTHFDNLPNESWQDLVAWDDEFYDSFFQSETVYTALQNSGFDASYTLSESLTSEQPYLLSAPPSIADEPPSLEHIVSAPPSYLDGHSFLDPVYDTSPFFDTTDTSPLSGREDGQYFGSFSACKDLLLSPLGNITEPLVLDTRYDRIPNEFEQSNGSLDSTEHTVFNPHIAGSSHSFSGLDQRASQVFSNVGTWTDQPRIIEPIAEDDGDSTEVAPIAIPQLSKNHQSTLPSSRRSEGGCEQHVRSRPITIPEANFGAVGYDYRGRHSPSKQRVPPALSVSPVASRLSSSLALSRSTSHSRRKLATPSPASDTYGWVSYHPSPGTNKLTPSTTETPSGRAHRGRKRGLTAEQRSHAALMRIVGACSNCQRRKEKCDPGTPCRACLEHYKGDLVNHPCRDRVLSDLSGSFLSDRLGWHPTARSLESIATSHRFNIMTEITYIMPLSFGFGPTFPVYVHPLQFEDVRSLAHEHTVYSWPPDLSSSRASHQDAVLPAVLTVDANLNLMRTLDSHLSLLVTHHFHSFPLYCSPLRFLREIYIFSRSIPSSSLHFRIIHQALKLLVLVHVGGDITLPSREESPVLANLIRNTMHLPDDVNPTPCFIRSQFGAVMPRLALGLMKEVLSSLEQLLLNKEIDEWPVSLAVLITVLMTIESIHYHAAKLPYHNDYDTTRPSNSEDYLREDDHGVEALLAFYSACYSGCHARLRPDWEGETTSVFRNGKNHTSPEDTFIENLREAIRNANHGGYLVKKANQKRENDDMEYFFDRLVARLLLLRP